MDSLASLYKNHIVTLQERTRDVLARFKLDALLIHSGERNCGSTCRSITGTTLSRCRPLSGRRKLRSLRCQKRTGLAASCLPRVATSLILALFRSVH